MTVQLKIDFVSDVVCPWCVIGLRGLEEALRRAADVVTADIALQPFELNPDMPAEGANLAERVAKKFGMSPEQMAAGRAAMKARGEAFGFTFNSAPDSRIYNTFNAHRLLHWAKTFGRQRELKHALFKAYFTDGANISDPDVLASAAASAGLDAAQARDVVTSDRYTTEVRAAEKLWVSHGINSVPSMVINETWLISGGQPPEQIEQSLRGIARELEASQVAL